MEREMQNTSYKTEFEFPFNVAPTAHLSWFLESKQNETLANEVGRKAELYLKGKIQKQNIQSM